MEDIEKLKSHIKYLERKLKEKDEDMAKLREEWITLRRKALALFGLIIET